MQVHDVNGLNRLIYTLPKLLQNGLKKAKVTAANINFVEALAFISMRMRMQPVAVNRRHHSAGVLGAKG